jgi:starch synthase
MTSLIPFFIKTSYKDDPIFKNAKVIYSLYHQDMDEQFSPAISKKLKMDGITNDDLKFFKDPTMVNVNLAALKMSDAIIKGGQEKHTTIDNFIKKLNKPVLVHPVVSEEEDFVDAYSEFYDEILEQESPVLVD